MYKAYGEINKQLNLALDNRFKFLIASGALKSLVFAKQIFQSEDAGCDLSLE